VVFSEAGVDFELYHEYPRSQILQPFSDYRELCDGQFIVTAQAIICLVAVARSKDHTHFLTPSMFRWIPVRDYEVANDDYPWLPLEIRLTSSGARLPCLLFVERAGNGLYVGKLTVFSYGFDSRGKQATLKLDPRLSRAMWAILGSYDAWGISINGQALSAKNLAEVLHHLQEANAMEYAEICLTHYEEDTLFILTNMQRAFLMYLRFSGDPGMSSRDPSQFDSSEERFRLSNGQVNSFSANHTVAKEQVLPAVEHFVSTGQLPDWIIWKED
jgi:hypothetical protein